MCMHQTTIPISANKVDVTINIEGMQYINVSRAIVASKSVGGNPIVDATRFLAKTFASQTIANWHKKIKGFKYLKLLYFLKIKINHHKKPISNKKNEI